LRRGIRGACGCRDAGARDTSAYPVVVLLEIAIGAPFRSPREMTPLGLMRKVAASIARKFSING
jgi:hypothetical protein